MFLVVECVFHSLCLPSRLQMKLEELTTHEMQTRSRKQAGDRAPRCMGLHGVDEATVARGSQRSLMQVWDDGMRRGCWDHVELGNSCDLLGANIGETTSRFQSSVAAMASQTTQARATAASRFE